MANHSRPYLGIDRVAYDAYAEEEAEEEDVEGEDDVGYVLQPSSVVWKVVEEDRDDAGSCKGMRQPRSNFSTVVKTDPY